MSSIRNSVSTPASSLTRRALTRRAFAQAVAAVPAVGRAAPAPPNIVFVFADQMRFSALGCMRGEPGAGEEAAVVRTPHLDRMAAQGALFTHAYSTTPVCSPFRTGLQTGRYSHTTGFKLQQSEITLPQVLAAHGYATGYIGKWHMTPRSEHGPGGRVPAPYRRGWDFFAGLEVSHDYFGTKIFVNDEPAPRPIPGYEPTAQTDLAIEFLERRRGGPLLLMLSWGPPHNPYEPPPEHDRYHPEDAPLRPNVPAAHADAARRQLAKYYGQVGSLDAEMGRILQALDDLGLADNTVVCFASDHGDMHYSQGQLLKRRPWEESARIPSVMRWPARLKPGVRRDFLFGSVNIMPTLLSAAGAPVPDAVQGESLLAWILGEKRGGPDAILLEQIQPGGTPHNAQWRAIRTRNRLYAESGHLEDGAWLLYDMEQDPYQQNNLAGDRRGSAKLAEELARLRESTGDGMDIRGASHG